MIQENQNVPWNKGKLIGQKLPLKLKEIWGIRIRLQMEKNSRELALFNLALANFEDVIWSTLKSLMLHKVIGCHHVQS